MNRSSAPLAWRSKKTEPERKIGIVESFTKVWSAPEGFENKVPYILALIKLDDDSMTFSELVDVQEANVGMKVESCVRKVHSDGESGIIHYGTKFRVVK